jgi:hypothetical protein
MVANEPTEVEIKLKAFSISVGILSRHLIQSARELSKGRGNAWTTRKKSTRLIAGINEQLVAIAATYRPKRRSPKRKEPDQCLSAN